MGDADTSPERRAPVQTLAHLSLPADQPFSADKFSRDNYFNRTAPSKPISSRKNEYTPPEPSRLRTDAPLPELLAHVVGVGIGHEVEGMQTYLEGKVQSYREAPRPIPHLQDNSQIERVLAAFDQFLFEKYFQTFEPQSEALSEFGRYVVMQALQESPLPEVA